MSRFQGQFPSQESDDQDWGQVHYDDPGPDSALLNFSLDDTPTATQPAARATGSASLPPPPPPPPPQAPSEKARRSSLKRRAASASERLSRSSKAATRSKPPVATRLTATFSKSKLSTSKSKGKLELSQLPPASQTGQAGGLRLSQRLRTLPPGAGAKRQKTMLSPTPMYAAPPPKGTLKPSVRHPSSAAELLDELEGGSTPSRQSGAAGGSKRVRSPFREKPTRANKPWAAAAAAAAASSSTTSTSLLKKKNKKPNSSKTKKRKATRAVEEEDDEEEEEEEYAGRRQRTRKKQTRERPGGLAAQLKWLREQQRSDRSVFLHRGPSETKTNNHQPELVVRVDGQFEFVVQNNELGGCWAVLEDVKERDVPTNAQVSDRFVLALDATVLEDLKLPSDGMRLEIFPPYAVSDDGAMVYNVSLIREATGSRRQTTAALRRRTSSGLVVGMPSQGSGGVASSTPARPSSFSAAARVGTRADDGDSEEIRLSRRSSSRGPVVTLARMAEMGSPSKSMMAMTLRVRIQKAIRDSYLSRLPEERNLTRQRCSLFIADESLEQHDVAELQIPLLYRDKWVDLLEKGEGTSVLITGARLCAHASSKQLGELSDVFPRARSRLVFRVSDDTSWQEIDCSEDKRVQPVFRNFNIEEFPMTWARADVVCRPVAVGQFQHVMLHPMVVGDVLAVRATIEITCPDRMRVWKSVCGRPEAHRQWLMLRDAQLDRENMRVKVHRFADICFVDVSSQRPPSDLIVKSQDVVRLEDGFVVRAYAITSQLHA